MGDIFDFSDKVELLNRFADKYILYVEGLGDRNAYRQIVGAKFLVNYDFQIPPDNKTGANAVRKRVEEERRSNKRVFGFLDGEAAAALGKAQHLVECDDLLFRVEDDPKLRGLIFVAAHELENLILGYCDVAPTIAANRSLAKLIDGEAEDIRLRLAKLTGRFLVAAMFKYASLHMQHQGHCVHVANTSVFGKDETLKTTLAEMKIAVTEQCHLQWKDFINELFSITRSLRRHVAATHPPRIPTPLRHLRLADGKALLKKLRGNSSSNVEGHLLVVLARSAFAQDLRNAIVAEVGVAA